MQEAQNKLNFKIAESIFHGVRDVAPPNGLFVFDDNPYRAGLNS